MLDRLIRSLLCLQIFILPLCFYASPASASLMVGHHYTAEKAYLNRETPETIRKAIANNKNAYYLGTQGHDWAYWAGTSKNLGGNDHAYTMHEDRRSGKVIRQMIIDLRNMKAKNDARYEKYLAFVAGWITHYITDTYVHYLVGLYGGNYAEGQSAIERHTQLEIVENYYACKEGNSFSQFFLDDDLDVRRLFSLSLYDVYGDPDFVYGQFETKLLSGLTVLQTATACFKQMCENKSSTCDWNLADLAFGYFKNSTFLDDNSYTKIKKLFEAEEQRTTVFDVENGRYDSAEGLIKTRIKIWDTGYYSKFLADWKGSTDRATGKIVQKYKSLNTILNAPALSEEEIKKAFPDIDILDPNINPQANVDLIDAEEDARYDDTYNSYKRGWYKKPTSTLWYAIECDSDCCEPVKGKGYIQNADSLSMPPLLGQSYVGLIIVEENIKPRKPATEECSYTIKFALSDERMIGDEKLRNLEWSELEKKGTVRFKKMDLRIEGASEIGEKDSADVKAILAFKGFTPTEQEAFLKHVRLEWLVDGQVVRVVSQDFMKEENRKYLFTPGRVSRFEVRVRAVRTLVDGKEREVAASAPHPINVVKKEEPDKKPQGDLESQAAAKYQWLKDSIPYLEALRELDRKTFVAFKNGVTTAMVRQFAASNPANYDDSAVLPDCKEITGDVILRAECVAAQQAGCGQSVGDARNRMNQYGSECSSTLEKGCKVVKMIEVTRTIDGKDVKVAEPVTDCDIICDKSRACDRVFMTYSGRAGYANVIQGYINDNYQRCLGDAGAANGRHQKELSAKIAGLPKTLPYERWQEYKAYSDWKGYLAALEKVTQEYGLPDPIPLTPVLPWTYSSPCGSGVIPGSTAPHVSLKKNPEKGSYKPGELVKINATVSGGKPPYAYTWTGDHEGKGAEVTFASRKGGPHRLSVDVRDSAGSTGRAEIAITVGAVRAVIENLTKKPVYGTWLYPRARIEGIGGKEKDYRVIWQSDRSLMFQGRKDPFETAVRIDTMGPVKIWAEIQQVAGEKVYDTVGETAQEQLQVERPGFTLVFDPPRARPGQEVKVSIRTKPDKIDDVIRYEWHSPESGKRMEYEKNARVIGFVPREPKPFKLLVQPLTARAGEYIGGAVEGEYRPEAYKVTVSSPRYLQSRPLVWKCDTQLGGAQKCGLYEVEYEFAVHHNIFLKADVSPAPPEPPRFRWAMAPEGCRIHNETSQELTFDCSRTGSFTASVEVRDKNDIVLGGGSASVNVTISDETLKESKKKADETAAKDEASRTASEKAAAAKLKIRQGKLDEGLSDLDEAAKVDPSNAEAKTLADRTRREKQQILDQIGKARVLMGENRFPDAQRELIVAKNLHGLYPPVLEADRELTDKWRAYDSQVRDKIYEVRSASEKKEFGKALEIAAAWRASTKLDPYADKALKEQEDWARKWKAEKDGQISILKDAGEKVKNYDYAGALKRYDEGFANGQNIYNGTEPEYKEALELRGQAFQKNKRLGELLPAVQNAAESKDAYYNQNHVLEGALKAADEAIALQPNNEQLRKWREQIVARAEKAKADNEQTAAGRKHLETARNAENSFLSQDSYVRADTGRWSETIEGQMQASLGKAIENYRESLKYIPDAAVEKHIRELEANLEARKKFVENVRQSKQLRGEADGVLRDARAETSFEASQEKFTRAIDLYNKSLSLYLPPDEPTLRQIVHGAGQEKLSRAFRKHYTDCGALEREGRIVEALAACEKAVSSRYAGMHEGEWILLGGQVQNLRGRVEYARKYRTQGEGEERAGKIFEAVSSYRNSLKNVPDAALEEYVRALEARLAEANRGKANADRLWQEGTGLYNQGQYGAALDKFKDSLGNWSDSARTKYVQDLEGRKTRAKQLRDEGYALQQKNQLQAAVGKYRESLAIWPDKQLEDHIRQIEAKMAAAPPTKPTSPAGAGAVPSNDTLTSKVWQFGRSDGTVLASRMRLLPGGRIEGAIHANESRWAVAGNELLFYDSSGKVSTRYNTFRQEGGRWVISGPFLLWGDITHVLREIAEGASPPATTTISPPPTAPPATTAQTSAAQSPGGKPVFDNRNTSGVSNQPTRATVFTLRGPHVITSIQNYHWNNGRGSTPGTIALRGSDGRTYGPWQTKGTPGQGGVANAYWECSPGVTLPAGTYTVIDSNPATWAQNQGSQSAGHTRVEGYPASGATVSAPVTTGSSSTTASSIQAELTNRSRENTHIFTDGESFGPANRLAPGEKRKVSVTMKADGTVVFKAGRDGKVMATKAWRGDPNDATRVPVVVFDEGNPYDKLTVTTGLR